MLKILKKIYNLRTLKNLRNYFRTKKLLGKNFGQINKSTEEGKLLYNFIKSNNFKTILEIGTWNGLGSTKTIIESIKKTNLKVNFYSIETDKIAYRNAKKNLKNDIKYVNLMYGKIVEVKELPLIQDIDFNSFGFDPKNIEWYIQDLRRYGKVKNIITKLPDQFDFILFDGGEFSTFAEFNKLYEKTKFFGLDDTKTYKQYEVLKKIAKNQDKFKLIKEVENFALYEVVGL